MAADANGRARAGGEGEGEIKGGDEVIGLTESGSGLDPEGEGGRVEVEMVEIDKVNEGEREGGEVGETFIAVTTTAETDGEVRMGGAEDGGDEVSERGRKDDDGRFGKKGRKAKVLDGEVEEMREGCWR